MDLSELAAILTLFTVPQRQLLMTLDELLNNHKRLTWRLGDTRNRIKYLAILSNDPRVWPCISAKYKNGHKMFCNFVSSTWNNSRISTDENRQRRGDGCYVSPCASARYEEPRDTMGVCTVPWDSLATFQHSIVGYVMSALWVAGKTTTSDERMNRCTVAVFQGYNFLYWI